MGLPQGSGKNSVPQFGDAGRMKLRALSLLRISAARTNAGTWRRASLRRLPGSTDISGRAGSDCVSGKTLPPQRRPDTVRQRCQYKSPALCCSLKNASSKGKMHNSRHNSAHGFHPALAHAQTVRRHQIHTGFQASASPPGMKIRRIGEDRHSASPRLHLNQLAELRQIRGKWAITPPPHHGQFPPTTASPQPTAGAVRAPENSVSGHRSPDRLSAPSV